MCSLCGFVLKADLQKYVFFIKMKWELTKLRNWKLLEHVLIPKGGIFLSRKICMGNHVPPKQHSYILDLFYMKEVFWFLNNCEMFTFKMFDLRSGKSAVLLFLGELSIPPPTLRHLLDQIGVSLCWAPELRMFAVIWVVKNPKCSVVLSLSTSSFQKEAECKLIANEEETNQAKAKIN